METPKLLLLVLLGLRTYTNCLKLPTYIKPCSRNDPNINACAKEHAISAIPHFIYGDPKYKVPVLEPFHLEELSVKQDSSNFDLSFTATNVTVTGLKNVQVKDIRFDQNKQHNIYDFFFPTVEVRSRYNVSGQVLILPISGRGDAVIVLKDVDIRVEFDYDEVRRPPDQKEYMSSKNFKVKAEPHGLTIHLENLFNGNKLLGDNMNTFLNENWKEVIPDLTPPITEAIAQIAQKVTTNIFELVPLDVAIPETV